MTKLKSVVKLPEKKEVSPYYTGDRNSWMYPVRNRLIEDIGNIDITEALKKNGWVKEDDLKTVTKKYLLVRGICKECIEENGYIKREDMELDVEKLAYQLFISELDFVAPDYKTRETWEEWKNIKHEGDCINEPQPCRRCEQDLIYRIAKALAEAFKKGEM